MNSLKEGHRERLRQRYLRAGENGFPDYDMLELLLTYAIPRRDVKPIARDLLKQFHNLSGILDASPERLCEVKGIGPGSAVLMTLVRNLCTRYLENRVSGLDVLVSERAVDDYVRMRLSPYTNEVFLLIFLDVKNQIIKTQIFAHGTTDSIVLNPKIIAKEALTNHSSGLIVAHNHPSGQTEPSLSDRDFTKKLQRVLASLDIVLLDHLVVSQIDTFSFRNHHLLEGDYVGRYWK